MRIKLDENLPRAARERLAALGWDVHDVYDEGLAGVIVLRPRDQSVRAVLACLDAAVRALSGRRVKAALWIVEPERLRIRDHSAGT